MRHSPPRPVGRLGRLSQPLCLRAALALRIHMQQPMVGLPAFVLPLAQLVLHPALQLAPLVHALALWIAAAQTPAAFSPPSISILQCLLRLFLAGCEAPSR